MADLSLHHAAVARGVLTVALILEIVSGINSFDTLMIMTGGGPANATMIWGIKIYKTGFTEFNLGGAAALSVLMFAGTLAVFVIYGLAKAGRGRRKPLDDVRFDRGCRPPSQAAGAF